MMSYIIVQYLQPVFLYSLYILYVPNSGQNKTQVLCILDCWAVGRMSRGEAETKQMEARLHSQGKILTFHAIEFWILAACNSIVVIIWYKHM